MRACTCTTGSVTVYVWLWPILIIRVWPYKPYMYGYGQSLSYVSGRMYFICMVMANPNHTCLAVYTVYVWLWPILSIRGWPYNPYMYGYGQSLSYVSHAGTDANVFINIFGKSGETGKTALEDPLK